MPTRPNFLGLAADLLLIGQALKYRLVRGHSRRRTGFTAGTIRLRWYASIPSAFSIVPAVFACVTGDRGAVFQ